MLERRFTPAVRQRWKRGADSFDGLGVFELHRLPQIVGRCGRRACQRATASQLDAAYIALRSDALGFLGTRALVAVLPAYLTALIEHGTASPVPGMLTLVLAPPDRETNNGLGKKRFEEFIEAMTGPQRAATAVALLRFGERYPETLVGDAARAAFDSHWKAYLSGAA